MEQLTFLPVLTTYAIEGLALICAAVKVCYTFLPPDHFRLGRLDWEEGLLASQDGGGQGSS